jgi:phosphate transport system substrate-binding protein
MHSAKRTLALVALTTTLISCTPATIPATTPTLATTALRLYASTATLPLINDLTAAYSETQPTLVFDTRSGSYRAMLNSLLAGETPYFLTNHLPADSPLWAAPLGQDGIAVIAHPGIEIETLTIDQLRGIFEGRFGRWGEVSSASDEVIVVISREDGSGTRAEFERLVMGRRLTTARALLAPSSEAMITSVAQQVGSIGYVSMSYLNEQNHAVPIDGVRPTPDTVMRNLYPLRSTLYIVGLEPPQGLYLDFITWMQSQAGQTVISQRYAPLLPAFEEGNG